MASSGEVHPIYKANDEPSAGDSVVKVVKRFCLKSFGWLAIYFLGYYDFSAAWLITPLLLTVLGAQWKKERDFKLSAAREAALANEKTMIESRIRVEDLPSWVFFPDKERAEWINSILQQLWPNVGHYTRKIMTESVEPAVKSALEGYGLGGFRFEKVVLGQIPPRITGIKVYDKNVSRDEIIMDMDLVFASDCDIKFSLKRITAKISDFSLRGLVRVVFKPLVQEIPLIGGVQVYFLTTPEIDFDLGGIANALDTPGLSNIIRKIVLEQIGYFVVLPNKYTLALTDKVTNKDLRCPDSAGVLRVHLKKADKLLKKDIGVLGMGKSDPYATLSVGAKKVQTKVINNSVNPEWNFVADFPIEVVRGQQLTLEILDHDDPGDDEFLGRATVATGVVEERGEIRDMWIELEDVPTGKAQLSLAWLATTTDKNALLDSDKSEGLSQCLLHIYVDCCHDLKSPATSAKLTSKPSPQVELRVAQGDVQTTWPKYYDQDPVFEQGFVFTVVNPHADDLHIRIIDVGHKNAVIAQTVIRTSDLLAQPNMEYSHQPFHLKGSGGGASIIMAAQLRCLKKPEPKATRPPPKEVPSSPPSSAEAKSTTTPSTVLDTPPASESSMVEEPLEMSASSNLTSSSEKKKESVAKVPSLGEVVGNTIEPMVKSTGNAVEVDDLLNQETELRHRSSNVTSGCGKVKLTLKYDQDKESLIVKVHEATGLPGGDLPDPPDPYVKLYLLPERSKRSKRKTDAKKDTVDPNYDEEFDYDISAKKLEAQQLEVTVVDKKGIFSRRATMGKAVVDLNNSSIYQGFTQWHDLLEDDGDSD